MKLVFFGLDLSDPTFSVYTSEFFRSQLLETFENFTTDIILNLWKFEETVLLLKIMSFRKFSRIK